MKELNARVPRAGFAGVIVLDTALFRVVTWPPKDGSDPLAELERVMSAGGIPVGYVVVESIGFRHRVEFAVFPEFCRETKITDLLKAFSEGYEARLRAIGWDILRPETN